MLAQITNPALGDTLQDVLPSLGGVGFFQRFLTAAIGLAFVAGSLIFFFILVSGAIQWIMSGGDKGAVEGARGRITSALIGIVVLFLTFAIIKAIERFFSISILTLDIGPLKIQ